jgi:hypothetical protein
MIDPLVECILSLTDAAKTLPGRRQGKKPHVSCVYRWTVAGCRGVVLESIQVGGTRCTSREAIARFLDRLTAAVGKSSSQSMRGRSNDITAAERQLDRLGV